MTVALVSNTIQSLIHCFGCFSAVSVGPANNFPLGVLGAIYIRHRASDAHFQLRRGLAHGDSVTGCSLAIGFSGHNLRLADVTAGLEVGIGLNGYGCQGVHPRSQRNSREGKLSTRIGLGRSDAPAAVHSVQDNRGSSLSRPPQVGLELVFQSLGHLIRFCPLQGRRFGATLNQRWRRHRALDLVLKRLGCDPVLAKLQRHFGHPPVSPCIYGHFGILGTVDGQDHVAARQSDALDVYRRLLHRLDDALTREVRGDTGHGDRSARLGNKDVTPDAPKWIHAPGQGLAIERGGISVKDDLARQGNVQSHVGQRSPGQNVEFALLLEEILDSLGVQFGAKGIDQPLIGALRGHRQHVEQPHALRSVECFQIGVSLADLDTLPAILRIVPHLSALGFEMLAQLIQTSPPTIVGVASLDSYGHAQLAALVVVDDNRSVQHDATQQCNVAQDSESQQPASPFHHSGCVRPFVHSGALTSANTAWFRVSPDLLTLAASLPGWLPRRWYSPPRRVLSLPAVPSKHPAELLRRLHPPLPRRRRCP